MSARAVMLDGRFKLGLFSLNASGGIAMTRVPERWTGAWDRTVRVATWADKAGLDFLLPLQRWRGYGGQTDPRGWCMETNTHAAALAGLTERISLFATVQVPIVHPALAARASATLDHVSGGRAGLNVVCGWNRHDFAMFDAVDVGADRRFDQGAEWITIFKRLVTSDEVFDHESEFFRMTGAKCSPNSVQPDGPVLMSAAFSPPGRAFAAAHCDVLFTTISSIESGQRHLRAMRDTADQSGKDLRVFTPVHVVCRESREEADDYYRHFAEANADDGAVDNYIAENSQAGKRALALAMRAQRKRIAGGFGTYGMVGSPQDITDEIVALAAAGYDGASLSFVNFEAELPYFLDTVLPRLTKAGLR